MSSLNLTEASDPCVLGLSFPIIHSLLIPVHICLYPHPSADAASQQSHSLTRVSQSSFSWHLPPPSALAPMTPSSPATHPFFLFTSSSPSTFQTWVCSPPVLRSSCGSVPSLLSSPLSCPQPSVAPTCWVIPSPQTPVSTPEQISPPRPTAHRY